MSMDSYIIFDSPDLSLFGGDLLGVDPVTHKINGDTVDEGIKPLSLDLHPSDVSQVQLLSPSLSSQGVGGLFPRWLDDDVDLVSYIDVDLCLTPEKGQAIDGTVAATPDVTVEQPDGVILDLPSAGVTELQVLQSVADEVVASLMEPVEQGVKAPGGTELDILDLLSETDSFEMDVIPDLDLMPALSPVTPEDIESVLSSGRSSPVTSDYGNSSFEVCPSSPLQTSDSIVAELLITPQSDLMSVYSQIDNHTTEDALERTRSTKKRSTPYDKKAKEKERKERKKQQNKDAATRYREKKRKEAGLVGDEVSELESRNKELHDKVDQMTREIQYLKDLLAEVYQAKGQLK